MSPSALFERLGAKLHNVNWSWGSIHNDGTVFLRAWADEMLSDEKGRRFVRLVNHAEYRQDNTSLGYRERVRHIQALRDGSPGYIVICHAEDPSARPREIKSFDRREVFQLGGIEMFDGDEWGQVTKRVSVRSLQQSA